MQTNKFAIATTGSSLRLTSGNTSARNRVTANNYCQINDMTGQNSAIVQNQNGFQFINETDSIVSGRFVNDMRQYGGSIMSGLKRPCPEASDDSSDSDSEGVILTQDILNNDGGLARNRSEGPKPGKKTKGRVKIKMEFIENKLRRYTTFSKRKTGIMKKAYELSTLTGTQVMLLVASETGHVYTFATRKLQPMITSESGKALIQTCLNSPDAQIEIEKPHGDQRMNPTGFEETELGYTISDEDDDENSQLISCKITQGELMNSQTQLETTASQFILSSQISQNTQQQQLSHDSLLSLVRPLVTVVGAVFPKEEPIYSSQIQQETCDLSTKHASNLSTTKNSIKTSVSSATQQLQQQISSSLAASASSQMVPQQAFYRIPGTNQIISLPINVSSTSGTVLSQHDLMRSVSSTGSIPESYILNIPNNQPVTSLFSNPNDTAPPPFMKMPIPLSLPDAFSLQMFPTLTSRPSAVSNNLLPTDLRREKVKK